MRLLRLIAPFLLTTFFVLSFSIESYATELNRIPQAANGMNVSILNSNASSVTLSAVSETSVLSYNAEENPMRDEEARPFSNGLVWALPLGTQAVSLTVTSSEWRELAPNEISDSLAQLVLSQPLPLAQACQPMIMRGVPLTSVAMNGLQPNEDGNSVRICTHLEFRLDYTLGNAEAARRVLSPAFLEVMRGIAANLDEVAPIPVHRPEPYLIITRPAYNNAALASFVAWKRLKGHTVTVATTDETGITNTAIQSFIQNAYNTWEEPPVFVTLIGDEDGQNSMPTFMVPAFFRNQMASDLNYSLLDGTDYFPDVFVGRISVDSGNELQTIVNKCINYESNPYQPNGAWRTRMLITGVQSSPFFYQDYNSAWPTLQWIARRMTAWGYTDIDAVPAPPGNGSQVASSLNNGVSFAAYRGFGAPDMWDFPQYDNSDINQISNGEKMPFVTSIVCGGGAFEDGTDPCFGELWLRVGTPTNSRGAIGFIGPSEIDTKTRWNNTNIASIYEGIMNEGINTLCAAMLRGKMSLFQQFPNNVNNFDANSNTSVRFYFQTYNLLGDPGLNFFMGNVRDLTATVPSSLPLGTPNLDLTVNETNTPLNEVWGTVSQAGNILSRAVSDPSGRINLALPQSAAGTVQVTLTKPRHMPHTYNLTLGQQGVLVAQSSLQINDNGSNGSSGNSDGIANPGERLEFNLVVRNFGSSSFSGGAINLTSENALFSPVTTSQNIPTLAAGQSSTVLQFLVDVSTNATNGDHGRLIWNIPNGSYSWNSEVEISSPVVSITALNTGNEAVNPEPNTTAHISLNLQNIGNGTLPVTSVILRSHDSRLTVIDSTSTFPEIPANGSAALAGDFEVSVGNYYPGDWVNVEFLLSSEDVVTSLNYQLPIGNLEGDDPTHPDDYGYRAFQDGDVAYAEAPTYAWIEVDPTRGGSGTALNIDDSGAGYDDAVSFNLPFSFTFYGQSYTQISICSNGFIAFGPSDESFFRNYSLPAIASPDRMVCVMWDDLSMSNTSRICTYHDVSAGRFIIEWSRMQNQYGQHPEETFELVLFNTACWPTRTGDGDMLMQYSALNNTDSWDNYATIGIQDRILNHSLQVTYANILSPGVSLLRSGQSILFTTGRPTNGVYTQYAGNVIDDDSQGGSNGNGDGIAQNGETVQIQIRLQNVGTAQAPASTGTLTESDAYITLLDNQVNFPTIPAGQTVTSNPIRVQLGNNTPNGHVANFFLALSGGAQPCVVLPSMIISGPFLSVLPLDMDDDNLPPSIGNNNGEFNPQETIELTPGASNLGGHDATGVTAILRRQTTNITISDSIATIGNVALNGQSVALDPFVLRVNNGVGNNAVIQVLVVLRDQYGVEWSQPFTYTVAQPLISSSGLRLTDPIPGGNNDGRLLPGESGEIYPRIANNGLGVATNIQLSLTSNDPAITIQNGTLMFGTISGNSIRESETPIHIAVDVNTNAPRTVALNSSITGDDGISVQDIIYVLIGDAALFSDFEAIPNNWSTYGTEGLWHLQQRQFASASHAYYCGQEGSLNYPVLADGYLRSPAFNYTGTGTLIYSTRYNTYDHADVCRTDLQIGPTTYQMLEQYFGDNNTWHQRQVALSGYTPYSNAQIRFWFRSNASGTGEGWYVDDVIILDQEVSVDNIGTELPREFMLEQNYPNPFNNETTIEYSVPQNSHVKLTLFDLLGRQVAVLTDADKNPGTYRLHWQPLTLGSGIYFIKLESANTTLTRKLMLLK